MTLPRGTLLFLLPWAVLGADALSSHVARADEPVDDEGHVQRGVELRREGRDREALAEFEAAWALRRTPRTRAQIGLAQQALGHWLEAESALDEALAASDDAWVAHYKESLLRARSVVESHLAWLSVESHVVGAALSLDGQPARALPLDAPLRVEAGVVRFELRAPGYVAAVRSIVVKANDHVHEILELAPAPADVAPPTVGVVVGNPETAGSLAREDGSHAGPDHRLAGVLTLSGAALLAVVGIGAWRVQVNDVLDYNDNSRCLAGGLSREANCGQYRDAASTAQVVEIAAFSASVVAAGVATWLLFSSSSKPQLASCGPLIGVGVACRGDF